MTMTKSKPIVQYRELTKVDQIALELFKELQPYWELMLIRSKMSVIEFAIGFYGQVDEDTMSAINLLEQQGLFER